MSSKRPGTKKRTTLSPALTRMYERATTVDERELDRHRPTKFDLRVAESLLAGCLTPAEIGDRIGKSERRVRAALLNPVRAAWITRQVNVHFLSRVGFVDAAVYRRALAGSVDAAKLFYTRMGTLAPASPQTHQHVHLDVSSLSKSDLEKVIEEKLRRAAITVKEEPPNEPPPADVPESN